VATILVVDDQQFFRYPIEVVLQARGYRVLSASDGIEAMAIIAREPPGLIVLDCQMPAMDGVAVLKALRADPNLATIPVIMLSGEYDGARIAESVTLGVCGYMLKSHFSLESLVKRVEVLLSCETRTAVLE
jgi:CheY-like chemotaxis protein